MGNFRVTIEGVGNHGCQREKKGTDVIEGCGQPGCVDCLARAFVAKLKLVGTNVREAYIHHWPASGVRENGTAAEVVDNLLSQRRLGSFT